MNVRPVYKVDAFTRIPLQGNPAGVVPFARGLQEEEMLALAREINAPESAFVLPSREGDVKLRFFTPSQEVPFCGHALVASLALLADLGEFPVSGGSAPVRVETGVGVLAAALVRDPEGLRVDLIEPQPSFRRCTLEAEDLLEILGGDTEDLRGDLPLELAYTGLWHLLVPLRSVEALDGLMPDLRALAALNRELGVLTTHVFAEEEGFHCRGFAPAAGVDEDPVSGSACGALGAYLVRHRVIRPGTSVAMFQGEACGRPGEVRVEVAGKPGAPERVTVGGHAVVSVRGEIRLGERP